jgi:hypothetical protein
MMYKWGDDSLNKNGKKSNCGMCETI